MHIPQIAGWRRRSRATLLVLAIATGGCTSWSPLAFERPAPAATPVQVWSGDSAIAVRELSVTADSITGQRVWPDSGRLALGRAAVDSLRIQEADPGKILIVGAAAGIGLLYAGVLWSFF